MTDAIPTFPSRFWTYLGERFPLHANGLVSAVFAWGLASAYLATGTDTGSPVRLAVAVFVTVSMFLLLRICDEFKDAEEDAAFRPERPVPRGLVKLYELAAVGIGIVTAQVLLVGYVAPRAVLALVFAWGWIACMTMEFGMGERLRKAPVAYLLSHMVAMPLVAYLALCISVGDLVSFDAGVVLLLGHAFLTGIYLEIGRKTRTAAEEQTGVETYSSLWGFKNAYMLWFAVWIAFSVTGTVFLATVAKSELGVYGYQFQPVAMLIALFWGRGRPGEKRGGTITALSGIAILMAYLVLGISAWIA